MGRYEFLCPYGQKLKTILRFRVKLSRQLLSRVLSLANGYYC